MKTRSCTLLTGLPFILLFTLVTFVTSKECRADNPPPTMSWTIEPASKQIACDGSSSAAIFAEWLNYFSATSTCDPVFVGNDFDMLWINDPFELIGPYEHGNAVFGPQEFSVIAPIARDVSNPLGGTPFPAGFFAGKIAVIDRGTYLFTLKVKNAQDAGAVGVIICNNQSGIVGMGGTDASITIPAMSISKEAGDALKAAMNASSIAKLQRKAYPSDCSGLPKQIQVTFTAVDACRNMLSKTAVFNMIENISPNWVSAPAPLSVTCTRGSVDIQVMNWLNSFSASAQCEHVAVTNDFCSMTTDYPFVIARPYPCSWATFGPQQFQRSGVLELASDGVNNQCCGALVGFTPGNIAVIDAGSCSYVTKVRNAQDAGAVGVIICSNNVMPLEVMLDDGTGAGISIPVIKIGQEDGSLLKTQIGLYNIRATISKMFVLEQQCFSIEIAFRAQDACGYFTTATAALSIVHDPPVFTYAPQDVSMVCNPDNSYSKFQTWLNAPLAASGCLDPVVTNSNTHVVVNSPSHIAGTYPAASAKFGPQSFDLTGELKLVDDGSGTVTDACQPLLGSLAGKIALIDRGICTFASKVKKAQDAGAIGVIICNNASGLPTVMGGDDASVTIPVLMITFGDGEILKQQLSNFFTISATLHREAFDVACTGLPRSVPVEFSATDPCGQQVQQTATFTMVENVPPVWIKEPADKTIACSGAPDETELWNWLNSFSADGPCGPAEVTNNFSQLTVQWPINISGPKLNSWAYIGPPNFNLSGELELAYDGTDNRCCKPIPDFMAGHIALIDRGVCTFVTKVRNAQLAGAKAVIIVNNAPGNITILMGDDGTGADITIPVLIITKETGDLIKAELALGHPVQVSMQLSRPFTECSEPHDWSVVFGATDPCGNYITKMAHFLSYPLFNLTKTVDKTMAEEPGGTFMYKIEYENISTEPLDIEGLDSNGNWFIVGNLASGGKASMSYQEEHTEAGVYQNMFTAEAVAPNGVTVSKSAGTIVYIDDVVPQVKLTYTVDPQVMCYPDNRIDWKITLENNGVEVVDATVDDDRCQVYPKTVTLPAGGKATFIYTELVDNPTGILNILNNVWVNIDDHENQYLLSSHQTVSICGKMAVTTMELKASAGAEGPPWELPLEGNLADGFSLCLDPAVADYFLDIGQLDAQTLMIGGKMQPFFLIQEGLPAGFFEYWAAKGVHAAAVGPPFLMYQIITGSLPMFFVYYDMVNVDYRLIDSYLFMQNGDPAAWHAFSLPGDFPAGTYTFGGNYYSTCNCPSDPAYIQLALNRKVEITSFPESRVACIGEDVSFAVEAVGTGITYQWYKNGEPVEGATDATLVLNDVTVSDAGDYHVKVAGKCNTVITNPIHLAIKEVTVTPNPVQYSDPVTYTAVLHNGAWFGDYTKVLIKVNGIPVTIVPLMLATDGSDRTAAVTRPMFQAPGDKTVTAEFMDNTGTVLGCIADTPLKVTCEDALLEYNGVELQATPTSTSTSATVKLIAVVKELPDGYPGNIFLSCVKFRLMDGANVYKECIAPVTPYIDMKTGIASCDVLIENVSGYRSFTIEMTTDGCNGYYCGTSHATLLVYQPVGDFITGGGHIITSDSYGLFKGSPDTHTNFGFHVKFNKKGTTLQGGMNIIYRKDVFGTIHEYQVKANDMLTLGVNVTDPLNKLGVFTSKANLTDLTTGFSLEGNLRLYVTMTDRGEPGKNDAIGITLWRVNNKGKPTILLYSSSWSGLQTIERLLAGGNLVVHSGFSRSEESEEVAIKVNSGLEVYPNPFTDKVTFELVPEKDGLARLEIYDMFGKKVAEVYKGSLRAGELYRFEYKAEGMPQRALTYRLVTGDAIKTGKLVQVRH